MTMLISQFIPSTPPSPLPLPISHRDQIQATYPSLRNLDKNKIKFLNLFPIYTTREIVPVAIQKCLIYFVVGTMLRVI